MVEVLKMMKTKKKSMREERVSFHGPMKRKEAWLPPESAMLVEEKELPQDLLLKYQTRPCLEGKVGDLELSLK